MIPNLENFQNEVTSFYQKVREQLDPQKTFNENYQGYFVFMSPIYDSCEIMFVGINPGVGGGGTIEKAEPDEKFDYLNANYALARETNAVFQQINKAHILESNVVKTNLYYLATNKASEIWDRVNLLSDDLKVEFKENSDKWTRHLISTLKPKIIICEGSSVFDTFCKMYPTSSIDNSVKDCFVVDDVNYDFKIIGYSRRFSNIRNKKGLGDLIEKYINY